MEQDKIQEQNKPQVDNSIERSHELKSKPIKMPSDLIEKMKKEREKAVKNEKIVKK